MTLLDTSVLDAMTRHRLERPLRLARAPSVRRLHDAACPFVSALPRLLLVEEESSAAREMVLEPCCLPSVQRTRTVKSLVKDLEELLEEASAASPGGLDLDRAERVLGTRLADHALTALTSQCDVVMAPHRAHLARWARTPQADAALDLYSSLCRLEPGPVGHRLLNPDPETDLGHLLDMRGGFAPLTLEDAHDRVPASLADSFENLHSVHSSRPRPLGTLLVHAPRRVPLLGPLSVVHGSYISAALTRSHLGDDVFLLPLSLQPVLIRLGREEDSELVWAQVGPDDTPGVLETAAVLLRDGLGGLHPRDALALARAL